MSESLFDMSDMMLARVVESARRQIEEAVLRRDESDVQKHVAILHRAQAEQERRDAKDSVR